MSILILRRKSVIWTPKTDEIAWYNESVFFSTEIYQKDGLIENTKTGATTEQKVRLGLPNNNNRSPLSYLHVVASLFVFMNVWRMNALEAITYSVITFEYFVIRLMKISVYINASILRIIYIDVNAFILSNFYNFSKC